MIRPYEDLNPRSTGRKCSIAMASRWWVRLLKVWMQNTLRVHLWHTRGAIMLSRLSENTLSIYEEGRFYGPDTKDEKLARKTCASFIQ